MDAHHGYVITGGSYGKHRLDVLSSVLNQYTGPLLQALGVGIGHRFWDNGCGGGNVAMLVAGMVGNDGYVLATDKDESILKLAEKVAREAGADNIDFKQQDAYEAVSGSPFDFAYARFLLSHVDRPQDVLSIMKHSVKPGGMVVAEDVHFSGHFCHPANSAFDKYLQLYTEVVRRKGGDAELGPKLPGLFRAAGLKDVAFDVIQPAFEHGDGKWMSYLTLLRISDAVIEERLVAEQELNDLLQQLEQFTNDPESIISLPRVFRVWGMVG